MGIRRLMLVLVTLALAAACGPTCGGATSTSSSSRSSNGVYPQNITITGQFSGHVTSAYAICIKSSEAFQGFVQDSKAGSALRFDFHIPLSAYHGAGTYGPRDGNPLLGTVYMAGQITWTAQSGTFTINPGEKGGSIHMHLTVGDSETNPEDISGTWRCG